MVLDGKSPKVITAGIHLIAVEMLMWLKCLLCGKRLCQQVEFQVLAPTALQTTTLSGLNCDGLLISCVFYVSVS